MVMASVDIHGQRSSTARKALGPDDISACHGEGPKQPRLSLYPTTAKSGRKRAFRFASFEQFKWLEYSISLNAAFCFACRHFGGTGKLAKPSYTIGGFQNWKKAQYSDGGFPQHNKCDYHVNACMGSF